MNIDDIKIINGENSHQNATFERNDKTIAYTLSKNLSFTDIINLKKGLDVISEFFDVKACVSVNCGKICSLALGKSLEEAVLSTVDSNPIDFLNSCVVVSTEVDSDIVKLLKSSNIIAGPSFTKNALEYLEARDICYVTINTPLKDYKKYLSNETLVTPIGTLIQTPNLSELNKDSFKVVSKIKPKVEQIEDAVFAWKIAKHANSQAVVIAKDLKTSSIIQGMQGALVETALDFSCERAKDSILASDMPLTLHDINCALQCRIGMFILPSASKEIIDLIDKSGISLITTGITNLKIACI